MIDISYTSSATDKSDLSIYHIQVLLLTNQIYLSVTRNASSANSDIKQGLIRQSVLLNLALVFYKM